MPLPIAPVAANQGAPPPPPRRAPVAMTRTNYLLPALGVLILLLLAGIFALTRSLATPAHVPTPTVTTEAIALAPTPSQAAPPPTPTATMPPAPTPAPAVAPVIVPPPATDVPPTEVPPTPTVAPTAPPTAAPTATPTVAPTATPRPPTPTATTPPPTAAPPARGNGNDKKLQVPAFDPAQLRGAYRRDDGKLYGLPTAALYGAGTNYSQGTFAFRATSVPDGAFQLTLNGIDDERTEHCRFQVVLNGTTIFDAVDTFPNAPANDNGEGGKARVWGTMTIPIPAGLLREGDNTLILRNATPGPGLGIPYILINDAAFAQAR